MPRPKRVEDESPADPLDLLKRIGALIQTRNALGKKSDKFCRLCSQARLLKMPCPHTEIWEITK